MPEVMKTRLQLQGELQRHDANAPRVYKNVLDVFAKTWRHEGVRGLQRGLMPAVSWVAYAVSVELRLFFRDDGRSLMGDS